MEKGWMGGTYYILNLISALNMLDDARKPLVVVRCKSDEDYKYVQKYTNYPYLECDSAPLKKRKIISLLNYIALRFCGKMLFHQPTQSINASLIFPLFSSVFFNKNYISLAWIPDFQEKHYPKFFDSKEICRRDGMKKSIIAHQMPIVFSSEAALNDFNLFYPQARNKTFVMHFAVKLPERSIIEDRNTLQKYEANVPYFFCANQFWQHKNHLTLFKALKELRDRGYETRLYCSGNTCDYRAPEYYPMLQQYIIDNKLGNNIRILGFIDRGEQLCLMDNAEAIIQPSYFEGWSTVVEDAKALHKYVILSDLPLHREQLKKNVSFFNPNDYNQLADKIEEILKSRPVLDQYDYNVALKSFGECFVSVVDRLI